MNNFYCKYVWANIWDILKIKNYLLLIWNSNWAGNPVFYLANLLVTASLVAQLVKNPLHVWHLSSIPGLGRSPGEEKGYPLHYSGLENSRDCIVMGSQTAGHNWATFTFTLVNGRVSSLLVFIGHFLYCAFDNRMWEMDFSFKTQIFNLSNQTSSLLSVSITAKPMAFSSALSTSSLHDL